ncbi:MAG: bacteriohopanetetrol glucosamine biosynthesis glycosyltransferase HpnI [Bryobacteraceae bacterium]
MSYVWAAPAILAGIYYLIALLAAILHLRRSDPAPGFTPPVSLLKPLYGRDPHLEEALRSQAGQDYPDFEMLLGAADPSDPALAAVERLPNARIVPSTTAAANGKVGVLIDLARAARHPILLVSDSDIRAGEGYLAAVVAPLADPKVGVVTCLYRATSYRWPGRWEALGIATEFAPSVLVAPLAGVGEFALGSTMVFRAADLERAGGFEALADFLADDYQLGRRISALGLSVALSRTVVETHLAGDSWGAVWRHQLRWSRTIRVSRSAGYYGYLVTQASLWSLVALATGHWAAALGAMVVRLAAGIVVGVGVLGDRNVARYWYLIPFRDLWGFAVWLAGAFGNRVEWRGIRLELDSSGRIRRV